MMRRIMYKGLRKHVGEYVFVDGREGYLREIDREFWLGPLSPNSDPTYRIKKGDKIRYNGSNRIGEFGGY